MTEITPRYDDEIDLFEFFETLWDGKWKIILTTFVAAVIGVGFSVLKPSSYEVSTSIQSGKQSVFLKYTVLNDLLYDEGMLYEANTNPSGYSLDNASVFKLFITEFKDYEEMADVVGTSKFVKQSIKDLDDSDKQRSLINFAKKFKIKAPPKKEEDWTLSFEWHDVSEGKKLFNDAILQTLLNTKNLSMINIIELADAIDIRNRQKLDALLNQLSLIKINTINKNEKRVQYLSEQSAIAKELGIETNRLDANALSLSVNITDSPKRNLNDVPFYLRGYKAIDKEISLIQNRSDEEILLSNDDYIEIKENILSIEKALLSSQLRNISESLANHNPNDWVEFDFAIADIKSQKKSMLYVALSVVLGVMVGAMSVLISNVIRKRKGQLV